MILIVGLVAVVATIGVALLRSQQAQPESGQAPNFTLTTFDGETIQLSDLQGQVVVLNFWASWCIPCQVESPALQAIWDDYRDRGVVVLGVAYADDPDDSQAFITQYGLTYPSGSDVGTVISRQLYHITGVPETFIIDQNGEIADFIFGEIEPDAARATLDSLLEGEAI